MFAVHSGGRRGVPGAVGAAFVFFLVAFALSMPTARGQEAVGPAIFEGRDQSKAGPVERAAAAQPPSLGLSLTPPVEAALPSLAPDELERLRPQRGLTPIGVHRQLPQGTVALISAGGAARTTVSGAWQATVAGRLWRLRITSPGARALRIHFQDFDIGAGKVWVHGADGQIAGPYGSKGMYGDGDFWSDIISGAGATIEYQPDPAKAASLPAEAAPFRIAAVSHHIHGVPGFTGGGTPARDAKSASPLPTKNAAPCHLDVSCYADWAGAATAVAHIVFERNGSFVCSGSLLNDRDESSSIPYFLTAAHCIDTDAAARSVIAYWRYQTETCDAMNWPARGSVPRTAGAALLAVMDGGLCGEEGICPWQGGDAALLRLAGDPPRGAWFLGWDPNPQSVGTSVTGIHHPRGSFKRISFGRITDSYHSYHVVSWSQGLTEGGSSGSPLFKGFEGSGMVTGLLSFGSGGQQDACLAASVDGYTKFSDFYPHIRRFLDRESPPPSPPTVSLTARPAAIRRGESAVLQWSSTNAASVSIDQGIGAVEASGTRRVSPTSTTTYRVTVTSANGQTAADSATVTVTAAPPPSLPTVSLTARPGSIRRGESAVLQWSSTNAASVSIDQGIGAVEASGTRRVSPTSTTTYRVTATSAGGQTAADSVTVTVTVPPPTVSLTARPDSIRRGESAVLQWSSTNAASISIDQGIGAVEASGTRRVSPTAATTYRVTATSADGQTAADSATVTVTAAPPPGEIGGGPLTPGQPAFFRVGPVDIDSPFSRIIYIYDLSFRLDVPANATGVTFVLDAVNPDVNTDMFVRFGENNDVSDGGIISDYFSETTSGNERVVITRSTAPPLRAGIYYASIALADKGVVAEGTLTATLEFAQAPTPPPVESSGLIVTAAGTGRGGYNGDGFLAVHKQLNYPLGVAADGQGHVYVADTHNHRVRKVNTATGEISTVAGTGQWGFSGDGGPAVNARLDRPHGVALDAAGNLYIADTWNHRIRRVDPSGRIATVAGNGAAGLWGDGGRATDAPLHAPYNVAADAAGNLYIADTFNNCVRKVDASGRITAFAGVGASGPFNGGFSGDGGRAVDAELNTPAGVALDAAGNVYIADTWNHRVRKVDPSGGIATVAGSGATGFGRGGYAGDDGPALSARLDAAAGVAADAAGNVYIADWNNQRIRKVDAASGKIAAVAGSGARGYGGDGGPPLRAAMNRPQVVALDGNGNLYIADSENNRIRRVILPQ